MFGQFFSPVWVLLCEALGQDLVTGLPGLYSVGLGEQNSRNQLSMEDPFNNGAIIATSTGGRFFMPPSMKESLVVVPSAGVCMCKHAQ